MLKFPHQWLACLKWGMGLSNVIQLLLSIFFFFYKPLDTNTTDFSDKLPSVPPWLPKHLLWKGCASKNNFYHGESNGLPVSSIFFIFFKAYYRGQGLLATQHSIQALDHSSPMAGHCEACGLHRGSWGLAHSPEGAPWGSGFYCMQRGWLWWLMHTQSGLGDSRDASMSLLWHGCSNTVLGDGRGHEYVMWEWGCGKWEKKRTSPREGKPTR